MQVVSIGVDFTLFIRIYDATMFMMQCKQTLFQVSIVFREVIYSFGLTFKETYLVKTWKKGNSDFIILILIEFDESCFEFISLDTYFAAHVFLYQLLLFRHLLSVTFSIQYYTYSPNVVQFCDIQNGFIKDLQTKESYLKCIFIY